MALVFREVNGWRGEANFYLFAGDPVSPVRVVIFVVHGNDNLSKNSISFTSAEMDAIVSWYLAEKAKADFQLKGMEG